MAEKYFMGLDYGTQGVRCGIADQNGVFAAVREVKYQTQYPAPGQATQSPAEWITCLKRVIEDCYNEAGSQVFSKIVSICACTTSSTVIPIDENGKALQDAILWMDMRAVIEAERINNTKHPVLKYCGGEDSVEWLVPKMMWIKENEPDIFERSYKIIEQQDFINRYLTGELCSSLCQATCKSNYVDEKDGFNRDFFEEIGFPEFFDKAVLDVFAPGAYVGTIRKELAQEFHLNKDVKVYQGEIDAYANMLGLGVCNAGETGVVMGSSFVHIALSQEPVFQNGIWGPYKDALTAGLYCLEGGQTSAASITKWFLSVFDITGDNPYGEAAQQAASIAPGSDGLISLDHFQGNRTPFKDPYSKGAIYGLTLSHTRAHIYRSLLEGVAYGTRSVLESIEDGGATVISQIRGCGGVVKNELWLQIISDVTGKPIVLTENSENAGVLGCAIIAAAGSGEYKSIPDACANMVKTTKIVNPSNDKYELYSNFYKKYLQLYHALKPLAESGKI